MWIYGGRAESDTQIRELRIHDFREDDLLAGKVAEAGDGRGTPLRIGQNRCRGELGAWEIAEELELHGRVRHRSRAVVQHLDGKRLIEHCSGICALSVARHHDQHSWLDRGWRVLPGQGEVTCRAADKDSNEPGCTYANHNSVGHGTRSG